MPARKWGPGTRDTTARARASPLGSSRHERPRRSPSITQPRPTRRALVPPPRRTNRKFSCFSSGPYRINAPFFLSRETWNVSISLCGAVWSLKKREVLALSLSMGFEVLIRVGIRLMTCKRRMVWSLKKWKVLSGLSLFKGGFEVFIRVGIRLMTWERRMVWYFDLWRRERYSLSGLSLFFLKKIKGLSLLRGFEVLIRVGIRWMMCGGGEGVEITKMGLDFPSHKRSTGS
jgi:hypothetical protein